MVGHETSSISHKYIIFLKMSLLGAENDHFSAGKQIQNTSFL